MSNLSPDTKLAIMNAAQFDSAGAGKNVKDSAAARDQKKLQEAAADFEAVFIAEMVKPMFEGLSTEAPFGGGKGEEVFRGMLVQEYGKLLARTGSIGIASHVKDAMIQMQEKINNPTEIE